MTYKRLKNSDIVLLPYEANKQYSFTQDQLTGNNILIYTGVSDDTIFDPINDTQSNGQYESLIFDSINHLFYQKFSGSYLNNIPNLQSLNYISTSINRPTSSYFDYSLPNYNDHRFVSGNGSSIQVISIPQNIFGVGILEGTFVLSSSQYYIIDDSKGNLYDINNDPVEPVGNIFYALGLATIINPDYQNIFHDFSKSGDFNDDFNDDFYNNT